jgi:predicted transcriptional regulator
MANAIDQEMYNYFNQLNEAEKRSVILMLKTFLMGRKENPDRISIEQYNKELEEAEAEFERGEYITHEELLKQMKKW